MQKQLTKHLKNAFLDMKKSRSLKETLPHLLKSAKSKLDELELLCTNVLWLECNYLITHKKCNKYKVYLAAKEIFSAPNNLRLKDNEKLSSYESFYQRLHELGNNPNEIAPYEKGRLMEADYSSDGEHEVGVGFHADDLIDY